MLGYFMDAWEKETGKKMPNTALYGYRFNLKKDLKTKTTDLVALVTKAGQLYIQQKAKGKKMFYSMKISKANTDKLIAHWKATNPLTGWK